MTLSATEVERLKHAPAVEGVLPVFHQRWSPRSFTNREVSAADLSKIFEAARWAASSFNEQPWLFFMGRRNSDTYKKIFDSLGDFNKAWAITAPVLILGAAKTKFSHNNTPNRVALYDLGAAASYLTLEAKSLGIATHQMAGFDPDAARKSFEIPDEYILGAVIALGYLGEPTALPTQNFIDQEIAPRKRKPLKEIVLAGWNTPADLG